MASTNELNNVEPDSGETARMEESLDDLLSDIGEIDEGPITPMSILEDVRQKIEDLKWDLEWFCEIELRLSSGGTIDGDESDYLGLFGIKS